MQNSKEADGVEEVTLKKNGQPHATAHPEGLKLQQNVTLLGAISLNVGSIIGSGVFITPTAVLLHTGSVGLSLIVWTLGGVLSFLGSLTASELACRVPKHGAWYAYLKEGFGSWLGFVFAYKTVFFDQPSGLAVQALTFSKYFVNLFDLCGTPEALLSMAAVTMIVTLCVLNMTSNRASVLVNIIFLYAKVLVLVVIIIGGLYMLGAGKVEGSELSAGFEGTEQSPVSIARSFYYVMYSYTGWSGANSIAEEVKNPKRNVPLASLLSVFIVTCIYVLTNISYLAVMSRHEMLSSDTVAMTWGTNVLGGGIAGLIIPIFVMTSTAGNANSGLFTSPRVLFAAARDGNMPKVLSYIHVTSRTPIPALFVTIFLAGLFACVTDIVTLIDLFSLLDWFFSFLSAIALLIIRFKQRGKDADIPFKQPLLVPVLFLLLSLYLTVVPQIDGVGMELLYATAFLVVGLIIYALFKFFRKRTSFCHGPVMFIQQLMMVVPPAPYEASG